LAPINTGYAERGNPSQHLINFYGARSSKEIGITFVGTTAISRDTVTNKNTLILDDQSDLNSFEELSEKIREKGGIPGLQLGCRLTKMTPTTAWQSDSFEKIREEIKKEIYTYSKESFTKIAEDFCQAINLAVKTGYEVIQLHAAHGYFLSLLLSPIFNLRKDEFGYPQCKLVFDIIGKTKQFHPKLILSVRMNCIYGLEDKNEEIESASDIAATLFKAGVDIVDFSAGVYDINKYLIYPSVSDGHACYLPYALKVRRKIRSELGIVSFAGNVWDLSKVDEILEGNMAVSIGRSLIADPQFVSKSFENRTEEIIPCTRDRTCPCHYFSNGGNNIECSENKNLGREI
jgi:2,4-dienoyl-CoA reductase-like NADH-dependent reductase (Old Yellow Enzyme family)